MRFAFVVLGMGAACTTHQGGYYSYGYPHVGWAAANVWTDGGCKPGAPDVWFEDVGEMSFTDCMNACNNYEQNGESCKMIVHGTESSAWCRLLGGGSCNSLPEQDMECCEPKTLLEDQTKTITVCLFGRGDETEPTLAPTATTEKPITPPPTPANPGITAAGDCDSDPYTYNFMCTGNKFGWDPIHRMHRSFYDHYLYCGADGKVVDCKIDGITYDACILPHVCTTDECKNAFSTMFCGCTTPCDETEPTLAPTATTEKPITTNTKPTPPPTPALDPLYTDFSPFPYHHNFVVQMDGEWGGVASYQQISLTDFCDANGENCGANPKYGDQLPEVYCMRYCDALVAQGHACAGFFYQMHTNDHEICGFYPEPQAFSDGVPVTHGHQKGGLYARSAVVSAEPPAPPPGPVELLHDCDEYARSPGSGAYTSCTTVVLSDVQGADVADLSSLDAVVKSALDVEATVVVQGVEVLSGRRLGEAGRLGVAFTVNGGAAAVARSMLVSRDSSTDAPATEAPSTTDVPENATVPEEPAIQDEEDEDEDTPWLVKEVCVGANCQPVWVVLTASLFGGLGLLVTCALLYNWRAKRNSFMQHPAAKPAREVPLERRTHEGAYTPSNQRGAFPMVPSAMPSA